MLSNGPKEPGRRRVSLFRNGRNQAIRIPREFELPGREAVVYRKGDRLILEPVKPPSLLDLLRSWEPIDTDWPEIDDPAPKQVVLSD